MNKIEECSRVFEYKKDVRKLITALERTKDIDGSTARELIKYDIVNKTESLKELANVSRMNPVDEESSMQKEWQKFVSITVL